MMIRCFYFFTVTIKSIKKDGLLIPLCEPISQACDWHILFSFIINVKMID